MHMKPRTIVEILSDSMPIQQVALKHSGKRLVTPGELLTFFMLEAQEFEKKAANTNTRPQEQHIFQELATQEWRLACELLLLGVTPLSIDWWKPDTGSI